MVALPRSPKQLALMLKTCLRREFVTGAIRAGGERLRGEPTRLQRSVEAVHRHRHVLRRGEERRPSHRPLVAGVAHQSGRRLEDAGAHELLPGRIRGGLGARRESREPLRGVNMKQNLHPVIQAQCRAAQVEYENRLCDILRRAPREALDEIPPAVNGDVDRLFELYDVAVRIAAVHVRAGC